MTLQLYSRLAWELRNHIHTYCVQGLYDNEVIVRRAVGNKSALLVRQPIGAYSYQWIEDPVLQVLDTRQIGLNAAREVLDAYYRARTFNFAYRELEGLRTFLEADCFASGVRPADHVRRMHLQLQPFVYARMDGTKAKDEEIGRCCRSLEALNTIQSRRTTVVIHVDLAHELLDDEYEPRISDIADFVLQMGKVISALRPRGLKITLVFEGRWDETYGLHPSSHFASSLDDCTTQIEIACA